MIHGSIGEGEGDGWVAWCVSDDGYSGEPTISFGAFGLFLGRGTIWGAPSDAHCRITVIDYSDEASEEYVHTALERDVPWTRADLIAACLDIASRLEAPNLNWIRDAVSTLWLTV